ncbi:MAG: acyltransferase [Firmicutes bacterium]|nr:acyltransferase [Bacillota bacterium]
MLYWTRVLTVGHLTRARERNAVMKIALGQVSPILGGVQENLAQHLDMIARARAERADVICFPELGLTGYLLQDAVYDVALSLHSQEVRSLLDVSCGIDVAFSFVEETPEHRFHAVSAYARAGRLSHVHRKVYLPTYGLFEEGRHLASGKDVRAFCAGAHTVGMMMCEDAWHPSVPYLFSVEGAQILYVLAAAPGRLLAGGPESDARAFWERVLRTYAQLFGAFVVFVNRTGFEDGVSFFGQSFIVGPDGERVGGTGSGDPALAVIDVDLTAVRRARYRLPLLRDEDPHLTLRSLARILEGKR